MANINFSKLIGNMLEASKDKLKKHWDEAQPYAEKEMKSFAENIKLIVKLKLEGKITEEQAKLYMDI